jgi:hypothetical protein
MALYAAIDNGQIVARREIADWETYPQHKKDARDERGDGGPSLRPIVFEGSGPLEESIIELDRVRIVRSKPPISAADVRSEAQRRIITLMGARDFEHCLIKQLNANARAVALTDKRVLGEPLTSEEQSEAQVLRNMKTAIDAIRAKSNVLEGMDPVPSDYTSDHHWM